MAAYLGLPKVTPADVVGHELSVMKKQSGLPTGLRDELSYFADGTLILTATVDYMADEISVKFRSPFGALEPA